MLGWSLSVLCWSLCCIGPFCSCLCCWSLFAFVLNWSLIGLIMCWSLFVLACIVLVFVYVCWPLFAFVCIMLVLFCVVLVFCIGPCLCSWSLFVLNLICIGPCLIVHFVVTVTHLYMTSSIQPVSEATCSFSWVEWQKLWQWWRQHGCIASRSKDGSSFHCIVLYLWKSKKRSVTQ